ncbi:MAG: family acetyltransferase [Bacilli bacterium]|nr:family acetyltransferase [Bacilli bacterium]
MDGLKYKHNKEIEHADDYCKTIGSSYANYIIQTKIWLSCRGLSERESSKLPEEIYLIEDDNNMVGYGVIWEYNSGKKLMDKAEKEYFDKDERYLEKDFYNDIKNKTDFVFIEVLDVLKQFEHKGYASFFIKWFKVKYPRNKMYVYTLDKSRNFWFKQGFKLVGNTKWISYN